MWATCGALALTRVDGGHAPSVKSLEFNNCALRILR